MITPVSGSATVIKSGVEGSLSFALDANATAHILNMLRSGVYKDSKLACIREYWCNARDSVVEAGKDPSKHVFIKCPDDFDANLRIRDEGLGLSEADLKRVFRKYGASTKRDSNEAIGCLGIGSKAAFAYSDTYTVTAVKNGWKRVFIASVARDSVAEDGIGSLSRVVEMETEEVDGVEISIPVQASDYETFYSKIARFFSFVPAAQRPVIEGLPSHYTISNREAEIFGSDWAINDENKSYAIMGGVAYDLNSGSIDNLDDRQRAILDIGVDITFPIGSIEFAISREEVRYTPFTQAAIKAALDKVLVEAESQAANTEVISPKNVWEAMYASYSFRNRNTLRGRLLRRCYPQYRTECITFNGKAYDGHVFSGPSFYHCVLGGDGKVERSTMHLRADKPEIPAILIHDVKKYGEWQRVRQFIKTTDQSILSNGVVLVKFNDDQERAKFFADYDLTGLPTFRLSDYVRDVVRGTADSRQKAKTFSFDYAVNGYNSESWEAEECDLDAGGVFLPLGKNLRIQSSHHAWDSEDINTMLSHLEKIGKPLDMLWGLRTSVVEKADTTKWKNFFTYYRECMTDHLSNAGLRDGDTHQESLRTIFQDIYKSDALLILARKEVTRQDSLFIEFCDAVAAAENLHKGKVATCDSVKEMLRFWNYTGGSLSQLPLPPENPIFAKARDLAAKVLAKYPMIGLIGYGINADSAKVVAAYINEKDA